MEEKITRHYQDSDHPFAVFITNMGKYNEGTLDGRWVTFPTTKEVIGDVLDRIGIGHENELGVPYEEWFITDYEWHVTQRCPDFLGAYESLDELNYLATRLQELDEHDYERFQAATQLGDCGGSLKDLINLMENLERYEILPDVKDEDDLGRWYVEAFHPGEVSEALQGYLDYEGIGRDFGINSIGTFTNQGYAFCNHEMKFVEEYDGRRESIPKECRVVPERERTQEKAASPMSDTGENVAVERAETTARESTRKNASRRMEHAVPSLAR